MRTLHFILLFSCWSFTFSVFGNTPDLEKLQQQVNQLSGQDRLEKLHEFTQTYLLSDIGIANQFAKQAQKLAVKMGDKQEIAKAKDLLGKIFQEKNDLTMQ